LEPEIKSEFLKYIEYLNTENIFATDGAKRSTGAGIGIINYKKTIMRKIRLSEMTSIFNIELYAIYHAARYVINRGEIGYIFSDAKSVLLALKNHSNNKNNLLKLTA